MAQDTVIHLQVQGLNCAGCVGRAQKALAGAPGVSEATVNLASAMATVHLDDPGAVPGALSALERAGYPAKVEATTLQIEEMHCASCVGRAETALRAQPGVIDASVNLAASTARVHYAAGVTSAADLARALGDAGYPATAQSDAPADTTPEDRARPIWRRALIAALLTAPVFVLEMGGHVVPAFHRFIGATIGMQTSHIIQMLLTGLVLAGPGRGFYRTGFASLARLAPDMNALVALGTLAAFLYSLVATLAPGLLPAGSANVYFEAAAMIVVLILIGRAMEARAKDRAGSAIRGLMDLQPPLARVQRDGDWQEVPVAALRVGDIVQVRPGERLPTDATVQGGTSWVDESMITGEPAPVSKSAGDKVVGGTLNGNGTLSLDVTQVGADTVLAQIIRMVQDAQGARLPIQNLVDKVTAWFVPAVLVAALATVLAWLVFAPAPALGQALVAGVSVLIIACPCAMGLAMPTSIMVGTGRAAELGVLFRRAEALQKLHSLRVIAFDKTGTLTQGAPQLSDVILAPGQSRDDLLALAATVEAQSEHPLARAICDAAAARGLAPAGDVDGFEAMTGLGVRATVAGAPVLIGTARMMEQHAIALDNLPECATELSGAGKTPVYVARDGVLLGLMGISDPIKPEARAVVDALQARGIAVAMLTGDTAATAQAVAATLGIAHVRAELMPADKVAALDGLRDAFGPLAFVGDGINDAPALAHADIGMAIGTGTDVAIEAGDIVLATGDPGAVMSALEIGRKTMRNIRQNLIWAFGYNAALIPVAAGALHLFGGPMLSPVLAAGAMAGSSVCVLANALRLRRVRGWQGGDAHPAQGGAGADSLPARLGTPATPKLAEGAK